MGLFLIFIICAALCGAALWVVVHFWIWLIILAILALPAWLGWSALTHWLKLQQVRTRTHQAVRQVDATYQAGATQMQQIADQYHLRKELKR